MNKRKAVFLTILVLLPLLTAMSSIQGERPDKIPTPVKKFLATFIDQTDVTTDCRQASIGGETFLEGKRGSGTITIPFENIREVSFLFQGGILNGIVKLRDGNTFELTLNKNQRAFGKTIYGNFQIKLSDLKKMTLSKPQ